MVIVIKYSDKSKMSSNITHNATICSSNAHQTFEWPQIQFVSVLQWFDKLIPDYYLKKTTPGLFEEVFSNTNNEQVQFGFNFFWGIFQPMIITYVKPYLTTLHDTIQFHTYGIYDCKPNYFIYVKTIIKQWILCPMELRFFNFSGFVFSLFSVWIVRMLSLSIKLNIDTQ